MIAVAPSKNGTNGHTTLTPPRIICVDIETGHADKRVIDSEIALWEPPSNVKDPEKIELKRKEFADKTVERSALLDGSPIVCIAVRTEKIGLIFNGVDKKTYKVEHSEVVSSGSEEQMLIAFREWLDSFTTTETVLVGFNLISFDLPRLRIGFVRHKLKLPAILTPRLLDEEKHPTIDVMRLFLRYFTADYYSERMISLGEVERRLELPQYKNRIDGSQIPDLVRNRKIRKVLLYCSLDAMATYHAYQRMTSGAQDMA